MKHLLRTQIDLQFMMRFFPYVPTVVCIIILMTASILAIPLMVAIMEEKTSGVKELMKIVGMKEWLTWLGWLIYALISSLITYTIVTYLLQYEFCKLTPAAIHRKVNPTVLWSCIVLYCAANTAFSFMFVAIFHQTTVASPMYVVTLIKVIKLCSNISGMKWKRVCCLLPGAAFWFGFETIKYAETNDKHLGWGDLFPSEPSPSTLPLGFTFVMMILDTFLYMFLTYYISAINPGKFGVRKSPFFLFCTLPFPIPFRLKACTAGFTKILRSLLNNSQSPEFVNLDDPPVEKFIEKPKSPNLEVTIEIKDLHKNFGSVHALKGVNLNLYKGEITALLGNNGAGKTTLLTILTGLVKPTKGSITYKDEMDVLKKMDKFRDHLGLCPQENRLIPYLTVLDHLLFFGQLKGSSKMDALKEAEEYMKLMEIEEKASSLVATLSGGMRRKLCLSIALMGKAEILILDEPTSGLDVKSRRKFWDFLLELRGSRTIILTTQAMEEADALGDRIAIMHHGTIVCHGTSSFLKKSYNTGYEMTITKNESASEPHITEVIQKSGVNGVSLAGSSSEEVVYKLPLSETSKFSYLFRELENSKDQLGVKSIGVSCTAMEQVFLKVCGVSSRRSSTGTLSDEGTASRKSARSKISGITLMLQQIYALLGKKFLFTTRNWINLFFRVIFPTLMMILCVRGAKKYDYSNETFQIINYTLYQDTKVMVQNASGSWPSWKNFESQLQPFGVELIFSEKENIVNGLLNYGIQNLTSYKRDVILAMEWRGGNERNITLLYSKSAIHSLPLGLGVFANYVSRYRDKISTEFQMSVPREEGHYDEERIELLVVWFIVLGFYTIVLNAYFMTIINVERLDGFKHIQLISKVSPIVYWLSNFIFDYSFFFLIILVRLMLFKFADDNSGFLTFDHHIFLLISIISLFIVSCLLFTYVLSYLSNSKHGSYLLAILLNILSVMLAVVLFYYNQFFESDRLSYSGWTTLYRVGNCIVLLIPPVNYSLIFLKFFFNWYDYKRRVERNHGSIPCQEPPYLAFSSPDNPFGVLKEVLFLVFDIFLYAILLSIIELGYLEKLVNMVSIKIYGNSVRNTSEVSDTDVQVEKAKIHHIITEGNTKASGNVLIAHGLHKTFINQYRPFVAVADVNFKVKEGECFGLLGVNGSGKSTTFRMLTGDLYPTEGSSSILKKSLTLNRTQYLSKAGYCAQNNYFLEELSGREMLSLVATLRGIRSKELKQTVDKWLNILGLEEYQNQRSGDYSGGKKRKLCKAMSLIGDPAVVFLDEPTSGVDPVARRRLDFAIEQGRERGQAVVLTSHSMEECENVCDRLTILVEGRMRCIGTVQHLKQIYAQGFSIVVKISDTATSEALSTLKLNIENEFNEQCVLKDTLKTRLYYQVTNVNLLWSTLFEKMEKLKESEKVVMEDYSLYDTSLEEVFIYFAKK